MKNGRSQLAVIVLAVIIAFTFGLGGGIAGMYMVQTGMIGLPGSSQEDLSTGIGLPGSGRGQIVINTSEDMTIAEAIAEKAMPSVVGISTVSTYTSYGLGGLGDLFGMYGFDGFGYGYGRGGNGYSYDATSVGTGVIVDVKGYILTNSHVVNDGDTKSISVSLYDGRNVEGSVLWNDATLDLAIVKIDAEDLVAAELGDSDTLRIGSYAAAIGNPLGLMFERSMSQGIISGMNRSIQVSDSYSSTPTTMEGLLQTDATINSGNSGGPLLNSKGQVIAINTAKASDGEGLGFAIPINVAKPIVEEIMETGSFTRAYIGISGVALEEQSRYSSEQLIEYFGTDTGIYVSSLTEGGGAQAAGMQAEDIITEVNSTAVGTMNKLNSLLVQYKPGDKVTLTVMRAKEELHVEVELTDDTYPLGGGSLSPSGQGNGGRFSHN